VFEVEVDGNLVYSKKATGRHAEYDEVLAEVRKLKG
jgi:Rdx family